MLRVLIAAVVGGILVFIWGAISHMLLGLGDYGVHMDKLPQEEAIVATLSESIPESGLYFVPGMDRSITDDQQQWDEAAARMKTGPTAFMVVTKEGYDGNMTKQLIAEAATSTAAALVAAVMLLAVRGPYVLRVALVAGMGLFASLSYGASEVIWYKFPIEFGSAQLVDQVVGWAIAGIFMAAIVKRPRAAG